MLSQGDASYEFEIHATEEEIEKVQVLFEDLTEVDDASMIRSATPGIPYHHDEVNDDFDYYLKEIYKMLYELGTEETRKQIRMMDIFSLR
jgi:hypothetical protein